MHNPFVFGEAVSGPAFINRDEEIQDLRRDLMDAQKVFLISPRRYGKTSLAKAVLEQLDRDGIITIYLDLQVMTGYKHFLELYSSRLLQRSTRLDRLLSLAKELLPTINFELSVDREGQPTLSFSLPRRQRDIQRMAAEIYATPQRIAEKLRKTVVVVFDEFQDVARLDGEAIERTMRSVMQHQRQVGYLFAGSRKHLMEAMIADKRRPFYQSGPVYYLRRISADAWIPFIRDWFSRGKMQIDGPVIERILEVSDQVPYFVQSLCHELWDHARDQKRLQVKDVDHVIDAIVTKRSDLYLAFWDKLTVYKRRALWAIAVHGGKGIFKARYISEHDLVSASHLQKAVEQLQKEDFLDREEDAYYLPDVFFREWLRRKIT